MAAAPSKAFAFVPGQKVRWNWPKRTGSKAIVLGPVMKTLSTRPLIVETKYRIRYETQHRFLEATVYANSLQAL